jgi:hypothetical protein
LFMAARAREPSPEDLTPQNRRARGH